MKKLTKSVVPIIESVFAELTQSEKVIATFFIENKDKAIDFSSNGISERIHVSEASLTRFAKKCGFTGYREFIYRYRTNINENENVQGELIQKVLTDYDEILSKTYSLIDEEQIRNIVAYFSESKRVYFYGIGSSGLVAKEMKLRFMRLGLYCDAITDPDTMKMNSALLDSDSLVIVLSISSKNPALLAAVEQAKKNNVKIVLFTANKTETYEKLCNEIVSIATRHNLSYGNRISPQFPLLVMLDAFYAYYLNSDVDNRAEKFTSTLEALDEKREE
ncbi:MurR/RpiR family transcriptional regulator [Jeotgalibaca porci]|uniref:MurR/RpiR family transcriptional regulator n=1 Tax=Jeotgalibaca TaxID=1470540 RepID=UPI0035A1B461